MEKFVLRKILGSCLVTIGIVAFIYLGVAASFSFQEFMEAALAVAVGMVVGVCGAIFVLGLKMLAEPKK